MQTLVIVIIIIIFLSHLNFSDHVSILGSEDMVNIIMCFIEFFD